MAYSPDHVNYSYSDAPYQPNGEVTYQMYSGNSPACSSSDSGTCLRSPSEDAYTCMNTDNTNSESRKRKSDRACTTKTDSENFSQNVMEWLNDQSCGGTTKRKRVITKNQRVAANQRERRRMNYLNVAFDSLRQTIPMFPYEKKMSRIQTLKLAIDYIQFMSDIVHGDGAVQTSQQISPIINTTNQHVHDDVHYW
ncbi:unnamed protein product [Owenia fusiformis]|uniref:BHLH domain-containing protein n=1 Tax=Owenia fusiformis TaxID=6347 RepID=A0A8S4PBV5_OWEFU|nr:unnamed protein product [Owenia fusiformis]